MKTNTIKVDMKKNGKKGDTWFGKMNIDSIFASL